MLAHALTAMRSLKSLLASVVLAGLSQPSIGAETVARYEGTGDSYTAEFDAKPPWLLTWRVSSDYPDSVGFELSLVDATSRHAEGAHQEVSRHDGERNTVVQR